MTAPTSPVPRTPTRPRVPTPAERIARAIADLEAIATGADAGTAADIGAVIEGHLRPTLADLGADR